jgi:imidazolonepropionase-like amidohydrolase
VSPYVVRKSKAFQSPPEVPNFDKEAKEAVEYDGLPPLKATKKDAILFTNVKNMLVRGGVHGVHTLFAHRDHLGVVLVRNGTVACTGDHSSCASSLSDIEVIDLKGGDISPGLVSFGSPLGLSTIEAEESTNDGAIYDPLRTSVPAVLGGDKTLVKAVDGLQFLTRDAL